MLEFFEEDKKDYFLVLWHKPINIYGLHQSTRPVSNAVILTVLKALSPTRAD